MRNSITCIKKKAQYDMREIDCSRVNSTKKVTFVPLRVMIKADK